MSKLIKNFEVIFMVDGHGADSHKYITKRLPHLTDEGYWETQLDNGCVCIDRNRVSIYSIKIVHEDDK